MDEVRSGTIQWGEFGSGTTWRSRRVKAWLPKAGSGGFNKASHGRVWLGGARRLRYGWGETCVERLGAMGRFRRGLVSHSEGMDRRDKAAAECQGGLRSGRLSLSKCQVTGI